VHTYTHCFNGHFPGKCELAGFPLIFPTRGFGAKFDGMDAPSGANQQDLFCIHYYSRRGMVVNPVCIGLQAQTYSYL